MYKKLIAIPLLTLPLAVGGVVYATSQSKPADAAQTAVQDGYVCPATGEVLPCENCCPLNQSK